MNHEAETRADARSRSPWERRGGRARGAWPDSLRRQTSRRRILPANRQTWPSSRRKLHAWGDRRTAFWGSSRFVAPTGKANASRRPRRPLGSGPLARSGGQTVASLRVADLTVKTNFRTVGLGSLKATTPRSTIRGISGRRPGVGSRGMAWKIAVKPWFYRVRVVLAVLPASIFRFVGVALVARQHPSERMAQPVPDGAFGGSRRLCGLRSVGGFRRGGLGR